MAPGVQKTFLKSFKKNLKIAQKIMLKDSDIFNELIEYIGYDVKDKLPKYNNQESLDEFIDEFITHNDDDLISSKAVKKALIFAYEQSMEDVEDETYQAMEGFIHNMNSLNSRAGSQVNNCA